MGAFLFNAAFLISVHSDDTNSQPASLTRGDEGSRAKKNHNLNYPSFAHFSRFQPGREPVVFAAGTTTPFCEINSLCGVTSHLWRDRFLLGFLFWGLIFYFTYCTRSSADALTTHLEKCK